VGGEVSVYVDQLVDRGWSLGSNCHLVADSESELHTFAARLGMRREWFQGAARGRPHYDLTAKRRRLALSLGAVEITSRELVRKLRAK
jgi:hypothetical protein